MLNQFRKEAEIIKHKNRQLFKQEIQQRKNDYDKNLAKLQMRRQKAKLDKEKQFLSIAYKASKSNHKNLPIF
jgi:hypothetical protein